MAKVVIAGAGLTGLSAAYHLERSSSIEIFIAEKEAQAGGLLKSVHQDGFTFDYTGHLVHISDDYFRSFVDKIVGFDALNKVTRNSAVYSHNTYTPYPFQVNLHGLPTKAIIECIEGFVARPQHIKKPITFYQWVMKYFGAGIGKHFFFPYNSKILSYDIRKVHPAWVGRFIPNTNLAALLEGALQARDITSVGYNSTFYYPKTGGIQRLITDISRALFSEISLSHEVAEIDTAHKKIFFSNGRSATYDHFVSTMPLNILLRKLRGPGTDRLRAASEQLRCNSVVNYNLGLSIPPDGDKHWIYYPEKKYRFYRVGFWHNVSASAVPKNQSALYGELSYMPGTVKPAALERIVDTAIDQTCQLLNIPMSEVVLKKILHLNHAYVIYDAWREKNLANIIKQLETLGIYSTGRFGAWKYSSMQEAVLDGKQVATTIMNKIEHHVPQTFSASELDTDILIKPDTAKRPRVSQSTT